MLFLFFAPLAQNGDQQWVIATDRRAATIRRVPFSFFPGLVMSDQGAGSHFVRLFFRVIEYLMKRLSPFLRSPG